MKRVLIVADAARLETCHHGLRDLDAPGYTALPVTEGAGRTGLRAGDRVTRLFLLPVERQA